MSNDTIKPIFYDPSERRAGRVQYTGILIAILAATFFTLFWASILFVPISQRLRLTPPKFLPDMSLHPGNGVALPKTTPRRDDLLARSSRTKPFPSPISGKAQGVVGGFYVSWDQASLASLREHAGEMTHIFPGWLHINQSGDGLIIRDTDPTDAEAKRIATAAHLQVVPLVNNFSTAINDFDEKCLHVLLASPTNRAAFANRLFDYIRANGYAGINLDFETEDDDDRAAIADFAAELSTRFHPSGLLVTACTQVDGDQTQTKRIADACDFIVPMVYDLHWSGGTAGPIAPRSWAEEQITALLNKVPADKVVLAVGNYAYDWVEGKAGGKSLTFGEAMVTAQESLDAEGGSDAGVVRWDVASQNPHFTYEEDGTRHDIWAMDAATAFNVMRYAESKGISGRALWYVGSEDPSLWSFFGRGKKAVATDPLRTVRYGFELGFEGEGEALDVTTLPQVGQRKLTTDTGGYITNQTFTSYPTACVVRRSGKRDKQIALTFDDGPDPRWTPAVLDALAKAHAPATFFVIGVNAQSDAGLLRREWQEGHLIGNHSFYHPNLALVSKERVRLEIDATKRAIQAATLHSTTLFRPPYGIDTEPSTTQEIIPLLAAKKLGYVTIGEGIDPRDWESGAQKQTAEQITAHVLADAEAGAGNIVLLHDSGGDRSETIRAIPLIVSELRARGYKIVGVNDLIGAPRSKVMPEITGRQRYIALFDRAIFTVSSQSGNFFAAVFVVSLVAGTIRLLGTAILALIHAGREKGDQREPITLADAPTVSVVIAAYNEEKVIARTIRALLDGGYPRLEVIVVDDGSKDDTSGVVAREFGGERRVHLITQANGGKASALNTGILESSGSILVGLDADTLFAPDTLHRLARHFTDPGVGAVAGNILVGNRGNWLTRWQAVEYTTSQNFDRRAYDVLNAILVVPGCVGAWRKDAVAAAGMYQRDTLAEDADLTWRVRKAGWRIVCDNSALAFTEAPERIRDLMKQRFRWTFGTLQVLWKHRSLFGNRKYGAFGTVVIPCLWIFQMLLPLAAPAADAGIVATMFSKNWLAVAVYGMFFFASELAAAYLAFALDGASRERRSDLRLLFIQRFVYRYVMFAVLLRAIVAAMQGVSTGWGKLDRRGTARVTPPAGANPPRGQRTPEASAE